MIFLFLLMEAAKVQICQHLSSTTQGDIKGFSFSEKEIVFVRNQFVSTEKCFPLGAKSFFQNEEGKQQCLSVWTFDILLHKNLEINHFFRCLFRLSDGKKGNIPFRGRGAKKLLSNRLLPLSIHTCTVYNQLLGPVRDSSRHNLLKKKHFSVI